MFIPPSPQRPALRPPVLPIQAILSRSIAAKSYCSTSGLRGAALAERSLPNLKRLQAVYGGGDFVVVSISEDDDESAWRSFVSGNQMNWPQRLDSDSSLQSKFGVSALPTYVLIGRDGSVIQKFVGESPAESIVERIGPDLKASLAAKL